MREEQDGAGAQEVLMPTMQSADLWRESGRYDAYGPEMLRIKDRHDREMLFGPTNEEMITVLFRDGVKSYRDLPKNLYHIQWKFRDEVRPRFGVMRGREFLMKDNYSFDLDKAGAIRSYNRMFVAYLRTFARMGLKAIPMRADTGPDRRRPQPRVHRPGRDRRERGVLPQGPGRQGHPGPRPSTTAPTCSRSSTSGRRSTPRPTRCTTRPHSRIPEGDRLAARGIEVGHIFYFGTKYSKPMNAVVAGPDGEQIMVEMGSYGIGVSRLVGGIIEASHDEAGIVWPELVAPFKVAIVNLKPDDGAVSGACTKLYDALTGQGHRGAARRSRHPPGRQVRRHGPDRHPLAGDRRPQGRRGRQGRAQEPQDRRAGRGAGRPGCEPLLHG